MFQRLDRLAPGRGSAARARVEARLGGPCGAFASNREIQVAVHELNLAYLDLLAAAELTAAASAGLSLGEYAHLVAIGALSAQDSRDLVARRGAAYDAGPSGCMAVVHPIVPDEAIRLCAEVCASLDDPEAVAVSNFNSPIQCVIAGRVDAVNAVIAAAEASCFAMGQVIEERICMHMTRFRPAAAELVPALEIARWRRPAQPYWPNVTAEPEADADADLFVDRLTRHVHQPVMWRQTVEALAAAHEGAVFVEVGPLQVLSRMMGRRWLPQSRTFALDPPRTADPAPLEAILEAIHDAVAA
jgi:[acyl-carrier-protein] S-malonyltransferase